MRPADAVARAAVPPSWVAAAAAPGAPSGDGMEMRQSVVA